MNAPFNTTPSYPRETTTQGDETRQNQGLRIKLLLVYTQKQFMEKCFKHLILKQHIQRLDDTTEFIFYAEIAILSDKGKFKKFLQTAAHHFRKTKY